MLKTVPQLKNGHGRTPLRRLFFCPPNGFGNSVRLAGRCFFFREDEISKGGSLLEAEKGPGPTEAAAKDQSCRALYMAYLCTCLSVFLIQPASAATIWEKASEIMQDVYKQILTISTIAAIVTASVALLMMNFSRSGRTVDESRAWLKRIFITWAVLNGLGFIMSYVTPFFSGGQWTP